MEKNIQEKINIYAKFVYDEEATDNMEEIYGKSKDVISILKENKKYCNSSEVEFDEDELKSINKSLDSLINDLKNNYLEDDFVFLFEHPMDSELHIQDSEEVLKDLYFYYLSKVEEETELKDINISEFIMCYFDSENISNITDYSVNNSLSILDSINYIYTDILRIMNIEYDDFLTEVNENNTYTSTIKFSNNNSIQIETKDISSYSDIASNVSTITSKYLELENELCDEQEVEIE